MGGGGSKTPGQEGAGRGRTGRGWKGAGPSLAFREREGQDPLGPHVSTSYFKDNKHIKEKKKKMFLHHTDSFHIAYLNTTVHFSGSNGTAYTRPSRVRNSSGEL